MAEEQRPGTWAAVEGQDDTGPVTVAAPKPAASQAPSPAANQSPAQQSRPGRQRQAPAKPSVPASGPNGPASAGAARPVAPPVVVPAATAPVAPAPVEPDTAAPDFPIRGLRDEPTEAAPAAPAQQWAPGRSQTVAAVKERLAAPPPGVRRARVYLTRVDPWTVMKTTFMLTLAMAVVLVVATAVLWVVLDYTGVFSALSQTVNQVAGSATTTFNLKALISFPKVVGASIIVSAIEIVLLSALATLFTFLYNLMVGISGGVEITLSEDN